MLTYEIVVVEKLEVYHSSDCIILRGNNGLILSYLYDEQKKLHVVEVERHRTQLEVRTDFKTKANALDFMFTFKEELPKLEYHLENIATTKYSLHLSLADIFDNYTSMSMNEESIRSYTEKEKAFIREMDNFMCKAVEKSKGFSFITPDYSQLEVRVLSNLIQKS